MSSQQIHPVAAPVLFTPEAHIFEDPSPQVDLSSRPKLSDEELCLRYEVERTINEIREGRWKRIALQFEDAMLPDAVRVYETLRSGLRRPKPKSELNKLENEVDTMSLNEQGNQEDDDYRLFILGDTSYGACCVDEIAAEHVNGEVVVHYGRSCLSPTARLPVIYVFTTRPLDVPALVRVFKDTYPDPTSKVVLLADVPFAAHQPVIAAQLKKDGYINVFSTDILHDPSSPLPNRTTPDDVAKDVAALKEYQAFHIGQPPTALLLILSSRVAGIHIYNHGDPAPPQPAKATLVSSSLTLRRRYALITSLTTVSVFGILINTLSVKNYLHIVEHVKAQISAAGKKHYTFVVGKVNAAKIANFSEIGGWVVIGCWESSLIESADFYRPLITPFELRLVLQADSERVWTGEWTSDFEAVLAAKNNSKAAIANNTETTEEEKTPSDHDGGDYDSEEESSPPEFDLRTGRYISHTRPMKASSARRTTDEIIIDNNKTGRQAMPGTSAALVARAKLDVAQVGGVASPGAEFLRSQRTWQGLGSDFETDYTTTAAGSATGAVVEEGRSGVARGYVVGEGDERS
jgi:diphthamide biosynthesis protein 2